MSEKSHQTATTTILPQSGWNSINLKELWYFRELFYFLTWRDLKIRYKQTILGIGWAVLQPVCTMLIFTIFFGRLASMPSDGIPYSLFALTGLIPWVFFSNGVNNATNGIVSDANLIKKVYFPKVIIPTSSVSAALFDFLVASTLLFSLLPFYQIYPSMRLLLYPFAICFCYFTSLGISLWLSGLNVLFRDIRYVIPFILQTWMFLTPIAYPSSLVPESWRLIYGLNPMVGVIDLYRWIVLGGSYEVGIQPGAFSLSIIISITTFFTGLYYFYKIESSFADVI